MRDQILLARAGVPWSEIPKMSAARRLSYIVAAGELEGRSFDWCSLRWRSEG